MHQFLRKKISSLAKGSAKSVKRLEVPKYPVHIVGPVPWTRIHLMIHSVRCGCQEISKK